MHRCGARSDIQYSVEASLPGSSWSYCWPLISRLGKKTAGDAGCLVLMHATA
jgi:hypothetical protein